MQFAKNHEKVSPSPAPDSTALPTTSTADAQGDTVTSESIVAVPHPSGDKDSASTAIDHWQTVQDASQALTRAVVDYNQGTMESRKGRNKCGAAKLYLAAKSVLLMADATVANNSSQLDTVLDNNTLELVRKDVLRFSQSVSLQDLIEALDQSATLHPVIHAAVTVFCGVIKVYAKRQVNNKKIEFLFTEMNHMMVALTQLIKTQYLEAELMEHITFAAKAIKDCANGCDAYLKKTKFAQVLTATSWNTAFEGYITTFVTLRERMMFTLTINACTRSPDVDCRIKLSVDDRIIQQEIVNAKERFASAESLEHQVLKKFVESNGGADAIKTDDAKLERLLNYPQAATARTVKKYGIEYAVHSSSRDAQILQLELVKKELNDSKDLEELIKNNSNVFSRKLDLQQEELKEHIGSQGDRIIAAVTGPHDGILDPDIREIWQEMKWSGHVKARHFVLALLERYRQESENRSSELNLSSESNLKSLVSRVDGALKNTSKKLGQEEVIRPLDDSDDHCALRAISLVRLQSILEAVDDDASGFVTIAEINSFTTISCPKAWSLPHWIAYWAVGWPTTVHNYRMKVNDILDKMFSIRPHVLPRNKAAVDRYLRNVWKGVGTLTYSFANVTAEYPRPLRERFNSYVDSEEERLRGRLKAIGYNIDALDTLRLVTGPGRVEKYLFPLLYLLLDHHWKIFCICKTKTIDDRELWDASHTIRRVLNAVRIRYDMLLASYLQQRTDPTAQFKIHANELFDYWHAGEEFWSLKNLKTFEFNVLDYHEDNEDVDLGILRHTDIEGPELEPDNHDTDDWRRRDHYAWCDHCDEQIYGTRVICMECGTHDTFDFCDEPACVRAVIKKREDTVTPHRPTHDMLKLRTVIIFEREIGGILRRATESLKGANSLLEQTAKAAEERQGRVDESNGERQEPVTTESDDSSNDLNDLRCISCSELVAHPCWYCVDCPAEDAKTFICQACEDREKGVTKGDHQATHTLVRCLKPRVDEESDEGDLQEQMKVMKTQITALTSQIEKLVGSLAVGRAA